MTPFESIHQQAKILYPKQHEITQKLFSLSVYLFVSSFTVIPFINPYFAVVCFIVSVIITAIVQAIERHYFILVHRPTASVFRVHQGGVCFRSAFWCQPLSDEKCSAAFLKEKNFVRCFHLLSQVLPLNEYRL